jgi:hypothetical protein
MAAWKLIIEEDDGLEFHCPLMLEGSESVDLAVSRFRDGIVVYKHALSGKEGRKLILTTRIDGRPTPEERASYDTMMKELGFV